MRIDKGLAQIIELGRSDEWWFGDAEQVLCAKHRYIQCLEELVLKHATNSTLNDFDLQIQKQILEAR